MKKLHALALFLVFIGVCALTFVPQAYASQTFDISDPTTYNALVGGADADRVLANYNIGYANLDNDGKTDLLLTESSSPYNVYVILGSSISGEKGQQFDLANSSSYFIKYAPATLGEHNNYYTAYGADLDGNGIDEIIIANQNASESAISGRGAVYIIYDSIHQSYSGTGNDISLSDTSSWNVKLLGAAASDAFGASFYARSDINLDGLPDLVISALMADFSFADAGSSYVIMSSFLNGYKTTTGNLLPMSNSANYTYRFDGAEASSGLLSYNLGNTYDFDNDDKDDLMLMAPTNTLTVDGAGSYYLISHTLLEGYSGTGNVIELSTDTNYSIRFDSTPDYYSVGYSIVGMADLNNNGKTDLILTASYADTAPYTGNGQIFFVYDDILARFSGTGNSAALTDSNNYTVRFSGKDSDIALGESTWVGDYNNDGKTDVITHDYYDVYVLYNEMFANYTGTGSDVELGAANTFSFSFTHDANPIITSFNLSDLNGDGSTDFVLSDPTETFDGRTEAGTVYLMMNFPHNFNLNTTSTELTGSTINIAGTVNAINSTSTISGVQYLVDQRNADNVGWTLCPAGDGAYDSSSEQFSCALSNLGGGSHTVYLRAYDEKGTYTASSAYAQVALQRPGAPQAAPSNSSPQPPSCTALKPSSTPEIFQITADRNSVTLYFTPVSGNANSYFIRYGTTPNSLEFGDEFSESSSDGVLVRKISFLNAKTPYYFQVRAGNDCMPGDWGNVMKATTTSVRNQLKNFFLYFTR